jgi:hypothetical protein
MGQMYFVPEGRGDRSLARSAWDQRHPEEPSRGVRSDLRRPAHRFDWSDEIMNTRHASSTRNNSGFRSDVGTCPISICLLARPGALKWFPD